MFPCVTHVFFDINPQLVNILAHEGLIIIFSCLIKQTVTFWYGIADWSGIKFGKDYKYPDWAEGVGWLLAFSSMITIPIGAVHTIYRANKTTGYAVSGNKATWMEVTLLFF